MELDRQIENARMFLLQCRERGVLAEVQPGFLVAGSETVILTSSPARRKTKKYFGEFFYTAVAGGNTSDDAYRQAILSMIANPDVSAMEVWSPFFRWGL